MVKTLLAKVALTVSHFGLVACLVAGLASGFNSARGDDEMSLVSCTQSPLCSVAAPDRTCYDYPCPASIFECYSCICTPQCNKSCACVPTPIPGC